MCPKLPEVRTGSQPDAAMPKWNIQIFRTSTSNSQSLGLEH